MNANRSLLLAVAAVLAVVSSSAQAQLETINLVTIQPNQTIVYDFPNMMPPDPDYKELEFIGSASVPEGSVAPLLVEFDFIDSNGVSVVVSAPTSNFFVIGGQANPINTGIYTIPFCPSKVSLHLTNLSGSSNVPIDVSGVFRHECIPVPEVNSLALLGLSAAAAILAHKRFGRRRS